MRERERRDSEHSSATGNEGATGGAQGDASSAGDVASESSLPDIQVSSASYSCFMALRRLRRVNISITLSHWAIYVV